MTINAPSLVIVAAGLSAIGRGGIIKSTNPDPHTIQPDTQVLQFWGAIIGASGGIVLLDKWNSELARSLAIIWIVGGILVNGKTIGTWLSNFGKGVNRMNLGS